MLKVKPVALAIGTVFVASLGAGVTANASENPFATTELSQGYNLLAAADGEGKCGEGKCGEGDAAAAADAAAAPAADAAAPAAPAAEGEHAAEEGKDGEGKCGEGKCGGAG
jgi:uncharacterized low-complexity protein